MYEIEDSISTYEIIQIKDTILYLFNRHNMAFPAWGTVASRGQRPYRLVTFDHHTDTRSPFSCVKVKGDYDREWISTLHLKRNEFVFFDAFSLVAEEFVAYDEQIKTAYKYEYLNQYYIICKDEGGCQIGNESDIIEGYNARYYLDTQIDDFLKDNIEEILNGPLILDFDVDFFHSPAELSTEFFSKIAPLIKRADAITIAREQWHFEDLRTSDDFTHEAAINMLIEGIRYALEVL